jgi:glutamate-ammonia-ligase adenylyltransferase
LLSALGSVPDPDLALLSLARIAEAVAGRPGRDDLAGHLTRPGDPVRDRLLAVLGTSAALGEHLARHPDQWT